MTPRDERLWRSIVYQRVYDGLFVMRREKYRRAQKIGKGKIRYVHNSFGYEGWKIDEVKFEIFLSQFLKMNRLMMDFRMALRSKDEEIIPPANRAISIQHAKFFKKYGGAMEALYDVIWAPFPPRPKLEVRVLMFNVNLFPSDKNGKSLLRRFVKLANEYEGYSMIGTPGREKRIQFRPKEETDITKKQEKGLSPRLTAEQLFEERRDWMTRAPAYVKRIERVVRGRRIASPSEKS